MLHIQWQNIFVWWVAAFKRKAEELSMEIIHNGHI